MSAETLLQDLHPRSPLGRLGRARAFVRGLAHSHDDHRMEPPAGSILPAVEGERVARDLALQQES